jgi:hypothetical protein
MILRRRYDLVLAIHLQTRGFAFVLFAEWLVPVDWGVYDARGADKNARCLTRIASLLTLHTPEVLVLQGMLERGNSRARRIRELNRRVADLADQQGMLVRTYSRAQVVEYFAERDATTKHGIAEMIAKRIPALNLYLPPARKSWMSEDARMGLFDAAALAWMFFHSISGDKQDAA